MLNWRKQYWSILQSTGDKGLATRGANAAVAAEIKERDYKEDMGMFNANQRAGASSGLGNIADAYRNAVVQSPAEKTQGLITGFRTSMEGILRDLINKKPASVF